MKIKVPLEPLCSVAYSNKCYIRRECPQNPNQEHKGFQLKPDLVLDNSNDRQVLDKK